MARRAKPGPVLIQPPDAPRGEVVTELTEVLERLDPSAVQRIRGFHGSTYLFIAEREDDEDWYEEAPRAWQRKADNLLDHLTSGLDKVAPSGHYFSGRRDAAGTIEWGFWPKPERNPEEAEHDDLLYGGFRENPKPVLLGRSQDQTTYKYKGRYVVIRGSRVQIGREAKTGNGALLADWESRQPFPRLEAFQVIDLMQQRAKRRKSKPRRQEVDPELASLLARGAKTRGAGRLLRYRGYVIDLQPIGQYTGEPLLEYQGMVSTALLDADDLVISTGAHWSTASALNESVKQIDKLMKTQKPEGRRSTPRRRAFHRLMRI